MHSEILFQKIKIKKKKKNLLKKIETQIWRKIPHIFTPLGKLFFPSIKGLRYPAPWKTEHSIQSTPVLSFTTHSVIQNAWNYNGLAPGTSTQKNKLPAPALERQLVCDIITALSAQASEMAAGYSFPLTGRRKSGTENYLHV